MDRPVVDLTLADNTFEVVVMSEPTPKSTTACVAKTTAKERQQQFSKQTRVSGSKLFCSSCNIVLDHTRKSSVTQHPTSTKYKSKDRTLESEESAPERQKLMSQFQATVPSTVASRELHEICQEWISVLAEANIPLFKTRSPSYKETSGHTSDQWGRYSWVKATPGVLPVKRIL